MKTYRLLAVFLCLGVSALLTSCGGSSGNTGGNGGNGGNGGSQAPTVTSISPTSVAAGSGNLTLTLNGSGFLSSTTVQVGGAAEQTAYVSTTQITAIIPASQLASGAQLPVVALNGSSSSGSGTPIDLQVSNPSPTITSVGPSVVLAGSTAATIQVTGSGFVPTTQIQVNGSSRTTVFVSATQVNLTLSAADLAAAGSLSLTAVNAAPGGGTSTAATVAVNNPTPVVLGLKPYTILTGAGASTITVTGVNFVATSTVTVNGASVPTTFVSSTQLTFSLANQTTAQVDSISVTNPAPGGGTASAGTLGVLAPTAAPVISSVSPTQIVEGSALTYLYVYGSNILQEVGTGSYYLTSTVLWNGTPLTTVTAYYTGTDDEIVAAVPASLLTTVGNATVTVTSTVATPSTSNPVTVPIVNPPPPTLTSINPAGGPVGTAAMITLTGTGFETGSTVAVNGTNVSSQYLNSTQMSASIPASALGTPGNFNITVTTPAPGGGTSAAQVYTTFISIPNNDLVYNSVDGLLYASVPASAVGAIGNAVVGIDPYTGTITRQIQVGTAPDRLALSTDGTQLFVGIDGAGAVAQINLAQGKIVNQFSLGGGPGIYNPPYTAAYLAAVPGLPNSVAVASAGGDVGGAGVTIYDSGVARAGSSINVGYGPIGFGSSASTLYLGASDVYALAVGSTGITGSTELVSNSTSLTWLQYDNGSIYLSDGQVLNAATGSLNGTFYTSTNTPANGPVVSDSTLGRAFMAVSNFSDTAAVYIYDETSFNLLGSIPVNDVGAVSYPTTFRKIVRWGQNGIAVAAVPSAFTANNQIFIFQSPLVKDVSSSPADLSVSVTAPATAATGTAFNYVATVTNVGPNAATGAALYEALDPSLIINSAIASQGSCSPSAAFTCDLGGLASGASATVTVNATPTNSGTLAASASVSSSSFDPTVSNNQATASTVVSGGLYSAVPSIASISPNLVQSGSADFSLTVNGTGFNADTTVDLGGTALTTTYVSSTQLTATVTAAEIANYGWAPVTVSNPSPGGGVSSVIPLTIFDLVNFPANSILFDPYGQSLYATIPSNATTITGNSVVAINPFTGAVGTPVAVGSQPTAMAESSDGNDLYISLSGADSLAQYDLIHQSLLQTISFSGFQSNYSTSSGATALAVMPGVDTTLAVDFSGADGIMDITGGVGQFRTNIANDNFPTFADATHLYTYDNESTGSEFYRYSIDSNGVTLIDGTTLDGMGGFSGGFKLAGGLIYGSGGGIINPATTPPSQLQTLPLDFGGPDEVAQPFGVVPDPSLQKDFLMLESVTGISGYGLVRYDLNTYLPEAVLAIPGSASLVEPAWTMQRFGQDGLALSAYDNFGLTTPILQLLLLKGPFIAPQELSTSTAAGLTSSGASSIAHGTGNTTLTLTGTNFLPGVAVTWNGSYRTTTIVDASHVTVAIPASDLANAGSGSLVATNPGAPASNALTITIN
jgi:trimeric autotransporter adhesin